jgi:hypothetical protein
MVIKTVDISNARALFRSLGKGVEEFALKLKKEEAISVLTEVARETPVDRASARSSWMLGFNGPASGRRSPFRSYPSRHVAPYIGGPGKGETANLGAVVNVAKMALSSYKSNKPVYISNNIEYIGPLNRGHSSQSSPGFIGAAVLVGVSKVNPKIKPLFEKTMAGRKW